MVSRQRASWTSFEQRTGAAKEPPEGSGSIWSQGLQGISTITRKSVVVNKMNAEIRVIFGERLRQERERLGLSQADMAKLGGTKMRTYQDWERDVATVSAEFLARSEERRVGKECRSRWSPY